MPAPRKHPDVTFELGQKLNIDALAITGDVIPEGAHRVARSQLGSKGAQRIPRAGGEHAVVRLHGAGLCAELPAEARAFDIQDARLLELRAGTLGAVEQHRVEIVAGV